MAALLLALAASTPHALTPSPADCTLCQVVLSTAAKFGANATSIAQAIASLSKDCDALFGGGGKHVNGTLDELCKDLAAAAVDVFPFGDKQIGSLAWDARAGCAALGVCDVPCCALATAPQQVHLALTREPAEMSVSWTTRNATATSTVQWGSTPLCDQGESVNGRTDTFAHFGWVGVLHTATMTGLAPGGLYYYRVGDASGAVGERWSLVWSFKALPADAGTDASPLRMASVGDMGYANNSDGTVAQLEALVDAGELDLVLHNGDISYADGDMGHWDVFLRKIERVAARVPYMVTPGNHEVWFNFTAYKKRFAMPVVGGHHADGTEDAMYWSVDVGGAGGAGGGVHLVGLNTVRLGAFVLLSCSCLWTICRVAFSFPLTPPPRLSNPTQPTNNVKESVLDRAAMSDAQLTWLKDDLAATQARRAGARSGANAHAGSRGAAAGAGFTVALGHRPLYASNTGGNDVPQGNALLRRRAEAILDEGGADLVLQAHCHDYERTLPVRNGAPTSRNYTSPASPVYVVNGAAGNREENDRAPGNESWSPAADPARGIVPLMRDVSYGVVTVTTDSLRFQQFFSSNGSAFDTFTITKTHQRREL